MARTHPHSLYFMTNDVTCVLRTFNTMFEADMAVEKLKANGIYSFTEDENVVGLNPLGGVELKVFLKDKERAEQVLGSSC